jgi:3-dehydroquinate dehydratase
MIASNVSKGVSILTFLATLLPMGCGHKKPAERADSSLDPQAAPEVAVQVHKIEPNSKYVKLGQGFNSLGGLSYSWDKAKCLNVSAKTLEAQPDDQIGNLSFQIARNEAELTEGLLKPLSFKGQTVDTLSSKPNARVFSQNALVTARELSEKRRVDSVYNQGRIYAVLRLQKVFSSEKTAAILGLENLAQDAADKGQFFSQCGDHFVNQVQHGAEVTAIMECAVDSSELRDELIDSLKPLSGPLSTDLESAAQSTIAALIAKTENKCVVRLSFQGGDQNPSVIDAAALVHTSRSYVESVKAASARPVEVSTLSYHSADQVNFLDKIQDKNDLVLRTQNDYVKSRADSINFLSEQIGRLLKVKDMVNPGSIDTLLDSIESARTEADHCIRNPTDPSSCKVSARWPIPRQ